MDDSEEKIQLSVIIPAYNVESYIESCLISITGQFLVPGTYEIIVINDGSTDRTLPVTEKIASGCSPIRIVSQVNRGLGNARNCGLRTARGEFVMFADSDDWLYPDTLPGLVEEMNGTDADVLLFRAERVWENGRKRRFTSRTVPLRGEMSGTEFMNRCNVQGGVWSFIYRRSFLLENSLFMPEGIYFEDELFIPRMLLQARKIRFSPVLAYAYRQRRRSITSATESEHVVRSFTDRLYVAERLCRLRDMLEGEARAGLSRKISFYCMDILRLLGRAGLPRETVKDVLKRLKDSGAYPPVPFFYSWKYAVFRPFVATERRYFMCLRSGLSRFF